MFNIIKRIFTKNENRLEDDISSNAELMVAGFAQEGLQLDYTLDSLRTVDTFLDTQFIDGKPVENSVFTKGGNMGPKIFALGCYVGEVLVRNIKGAKWNTLGYDSPEKEILIEVVLLDGSVCAPVIKTIGRVKNGQEDSLYPYGQILAGNGKTFTADELIKEFSKN